LIDYSKKYSEESFWRKLKNHASIAGKQLVEKALTLYYCLKDEDTPAKAKATIIGALGYFIWPLDAMPDPVYVDDLGAVALALLLVAASIKRTHKSKAKKQTEDWFGKSNP